jgi:hypothetical protein
VLRRTSLLLCLCLLALAATRVGTTASASAGAERFLVTLTGSQRTVVTDASRTVDDRGCETSTDGRDRQRLEFASTRPVKIALGADGRLAPVGIPVRVAVTGARERHITLSGSPPCPSRVADIETPCGPARVAGHAVVALPAASRIVLRGSYDRRSDQARCAPQLARAAPFLVESEGRIDGRNLQNPRIRRITLTGSTQVNHELRSGGRVAIQVDWRLVLTRTA